MEQNVLDDILDNFINIGMVLKETLGTVVVFVGLFYKKLDI